MPNTNATTPPQDSATAQSTIWPKARADSNIEESSARALATISRRADSHTDRLNRIKAANATTNPDAVTTAEASFATGDFLYGVDSFLVTFPEAATVADVRTAIFNHLRLTGRHILR